MTQNNITQQLQLVMIQEFKDTSAGRMLFAVTEVCTEDFQFEGQSLLTHNTALLQK